MHHMHFVPLGRAEGCLHALYHDADFTIQGGVMHTEISTATIRTTRRVYYVCSYLFVFFELVSYFFSYRVEKSDTKILFLGSQVFR